MTSTLQYESCITIIYARPSPLDVVLNMVTSDACQTGTGDTVKSAIQKENEKTHGKYEKINYLNLQLNDRCNCSVVRACLCAKEGDSKS